MEEGYAVVEYIGDYPLDNQPNWMKIFTNLDKARAAARACVGPLPLSDYYVVVIDCCTVEGKFFSAGEKEEMYFVVHLGKEYDGFEATKRWEEDHHTMIHGE